jgi:NADH-quinone oxidoreductase subunit J
MMAHMPGAVFYALSAGLVMAALLTVTMRSMFYSAVALVASLTFVAGIFLLFGADFLGAAQVLVYIGGIMIIMLFVIMLSQSPRDTIEAQTNHQWMPAMFFSAVIGISLIRGFKLILGSPQPVREMVATSAPLGRLLLGEMVLPFEAVSLILLAALVGAVLFGQDKIS